MLLAALAPLGGCFWLLVGGAAEGGYVAGQKERSAGETFSDQWIFTKVKSSLIAEKDLQAGKIDVDVARGVVTLSGLVKTERERRLAVSIARNVKGVKSVVDRLALP